MPNPWGRQPRSEMWQDLQALAFWVVVIGIIGYLLFPNFFKDIYSRVNPTVAETSNLSDVSLPDTANTDSFTAPGLSIQNFPNVSSALYSNKNDISTGYWVIFVAEGEFKQFAVSADTYAFLQRLIESDQKGVAKSTVMLASNGQIHKYIVSDEIYTIITNMALIDTRAHSN